MPKFRAWDIENKKMVYGLDLTNGDMGYYPHLDNDECVDLCDQHIGAVHPIVMQYTGVKDNSDIEICAGDILSVPNPRIRYVVKFGCYDNGGDYENNECGTGFYLEDSNTGKIVSLQREFNTTFEIMGNIYKNPDFIKEK